ncbi:hypothetical protein Tco_0473928 [Tanacetum coccineum]
MGASHDLIVLSKAHRKRCRASRGGFLLLGLKDFKMILRDYCCSVLLVQKVYAAGLQLLEELLLSEG